MNDFAIQQMINDAIKADNEEYVQSSFHASSLGSCLTGAYLTRKGICKKEFDDRTLRVFHCGKMFEDWVVSLLEKSGKHVEKQKRVEIEALNASGKIDIICDGKLFEVKSKNSQAFTYMVKKGEGAQHQHKLQVWFYLHCLGMQRGDILYISRDDLRMAQYPVMLDDKELEADVMRELTILNEAWKQGLPPPPITDKKDWRYRYCDCHEEHCLTQEKYLDISTLK